MSFISDLLDPLDFEMLSDYMNYGADGVGFWEGFPGNSGQLSIVQNHILPAVQEHVNDARKNWPYGANPQDYLNDVMGSYDEEVLTRAFSGAIEESHDVMYQYWDNAMGLQAEHDSIVASIGGSFGPHSTSGNWYS